MDPKTEFKEEARGAAQKMIELMQDLEDETFRVRVYIDKLFDCKLNRTERTAARKALDILNGVWTGEGESFENQLEQFAYAIKELRDQL